MAVTDPRLPALHADPAPDIAVDRVREAARRRRRSLRILQVGASCGLDTAMLAGFAALGMCDWRLVLLYGGLGLGSTAVFLLIVRLPGIERRHDPFLTTWQVATALAIQTAAMYAAPGMTVFFFPLLFLIYAFASLSMDLRTLLAGAGLNSLAILPLFASGDPARLLPALDAHATLLLGAFLMLTLVRCIVVGDFGYRMRARSYARQVAADAAAQALEARVAERTTALTAANRELSEANQRLQAYSYAMAHEFRAPLRAIDGYAAILGEDYRERALDAEALTLIGRVRRAGERMTNLVDALVHLAGLGVAHPVRADVDLVAIASAIMAEHATREPARRIDWVHPERLVVRADARLMEAALRVLLDNARKFTSARSHARIELGSREVDGRTVYFVRDNGVGFERAYADKLFGVFQRLHSSEAFDGSGVGLAVLERIITLHGGRVRAESAPDQGTTFHFTLGEA